MIYKEICKVQNKVNAYEQQNGISSADQEGLEEKSYGRSEIHLEGGE